MTKTRTMSSGRHISVGVCVPSLGSWEPDFGFSLVRLFAKTTAWRPDPKENIVSLRLNLYKLETSMLVKSRQHLVASAIKDGCSHVLFLDSDMVFPDDTLIRLLRRNKDFIAVNCTTRTYPTYHIAHDLDGKLIDSRKKVGVQKVQHVGLAVALFSTSIPMQMEPPLFMMEWIPEVMAHCGEDVYFCAKAQHLGYDLWIDHDLSHEVLHVGKQLYGPGLIDAEKPEPRLKGSLTPEEGGSRLAVVED